MSRTEKIRSTSVPWLSRHAGRLAIGEFVVGGTIHAEVETRKMKLDLLAIAAHPDDVELTCGGTLLKMAQKGYQTGVLDLTQGEMGTRGTRETRAEEAAAAAKILKVSWRGNLGVPDSDVQPTRQHKVHLAKMI